MSKVSEVVIKVIKIRTGVSKTLHTDRIRVIHEDNMTPLQNQNVRKAYPVHEEGETSETKRTLQSLDPFPFYNDDDSDSEEIDSTAGDNQPDSAEGDSGPETEDSPPQRRYPLRSTTTLSDLPLVMHKPLEYSKAHKSTK